MAVLVAYFDPTYEVVSLRAAQPDGSFVPILRKPAVSTSSATTALQMSDFIVDGWSSVPGQTLMVGVNPRREVQRRDLKASERRALRLAVDQARCPFCNAIKMSMMSFYPVRALCRGCGSSIAFDYHIFVRTNGRTYRGRAAALSNLRVIA